MEAAQGFLLYYSSAPVQKMKPKQHIIWSYGKGKEAALQQPLN
jgi:hypothetical protein